MLVSDMQRVFFLTAFMIILSIPGLSAVDSASRSLIETGRIIILRHENEAVLLIEQSQPAGRQSGIEISLSGMGTLRLQAGLRTETIKFSIGEIRENINIYAGTAGFFPEKITITGTGNGFDLLSAHTYQAGDALTPLPADIGHIIFSDFSSDGNTEWELYSWNLFPEVLIFDTVDYEVQSRLFKRLAFFVEKPGFVGTLVPNKDLNGRHGWNAHDYKADDLAAFFTKAEAENFTLNPEELVLKQILINCGIIIGNSGTEMKTFSAGEGAVLSVSRETLPDWRYRFLTHECLHGIFFTKSDYREEIEKVFTSLDSEEVEFWKHLLDYRRYDVNNSYLVVNEFMAYSLQQPKDETDDYFKGFLYKKMIAARPYEKGFVEKFEKTHSDSFRRAVSSLGLVLLSYTGREPGHLANLYPQDLSPSFFNLFPASE
ncbi:MAG: hypothetical protein JEZ04_06165 [Spirochaetales bacterium]|nr:hypothetical protein [Spirochaetales bacterium]